jgi:hypothetical protein
VKRSRLPGRRHASVYGRLHEVVRASWPRPCVPCIFLNEIESWQGTCPQWLNRVGVSLVDDLLATALRSQHRRRQR